MNRWRGRPAPDRGRRAGTYVELCDYLRLVQSLEILHQEGGNKKRAAEKAANAPPKGLLPKGGKKNPPAPACPSSGASQSRAQVSWTAPTPTSRPWGRR